MHSDPFQCTSCGTTDESVKQPQRRLCVPCFQEWRRLNRNAWGKRNRERERELRRQSWWRHRDYNVQRALERKKLTHRADRQYEKEHFPEAFRARWTLRNHVKRGTIKKPERCDRCKERYPPRRIHGHHHDYSKPLEVEWVCSVCHGKEHRATV